MTKPSSSLIISIFLFSISIIAMEAERPAYKTISGESIYLDPQQLFSIVNLYDLQQYESDSIDNITPYYWSDDLNLETKQNFLTKIDNYNNTVNSTDIYITLTELLRLTNYRNFHDIKAKEIFNNHYLFSIDIGALHIRHSNALTALARSFRMKKKIIIDTTKYNETMLRKALVDQILIELYQENSIDKAQQALKNISSVPVKNSECFIS